MYDLELLEIREKMEFRISPDSDAAQRCFLAWIIQGFSAIFFKPLTLIPVASVISNANVLGKQGAPY